MNRRILRSPDVILLKQAGWYRLSGFEFSVCPIVYSKCHIWMPVCNNYNTYKAPTLWKTSKVWVSSVPRQGRPSMLFKFIKITSVNIWILCHVVSRYLEMYQNISQCKINNHPQNIKHSIAVLALFFFSQSTCVIVNVRSHACKSHVL